MTIEQGRALVAGGAGFLGSHLCGKLLADGWTVTCLDNLQTGRIENIGPLLIHPRFSLVSGDVSEAVSDAVAGEHFEEIYNLACAASPPAYQRDPEHTMMTSVLGTRNLLRLAEKTGARFFLASTSEIYGDPLEHPQHERYQGNVNAIGPRACYDEGKRAAETLAFDFERHGRVAVRVARIFNTYGPRLDPEDGRVVSNMLAQAISGDPLTVYGEGTQTRSFCFVDDMIRGILCLMRCPTQPGPVNLGNPVEVTMLELAERISDMAGDQGVVHMPLPADDPKRRRPDISRAIQHLGWEPVVGLNEGLRTTFDWFAARERILPSPVIEALAVA